MFIKVNNVPKLDAGLKYYKIYIRHGRDRHILIIVSDELILIIYRDNRDRR